MLVCMVNKVVSRDDNADLYSERIMDLHDTPVTIYDHMCERSGNYLIVTTYLKYDNNETDLILYNKMYLK